jgi:hypothetical protein
MPIRRTSNKSSYDSGFYNPEVYSDVGSRRIFEFDSNALSYLNAVEAADGEALEFGVKVAVNDFVIGCKADGIWSAIKASCILAGARTLSGALVPLVGTAPTNFNFVSGDYNRETGLVGNGSTKYLDSNRNNNADPQNNYHFATFIGAASSVGCIYIGSGVTTGEPGVSNVYWDGGNQVGFRNRTGNIDFFSSGSPIGLLGTSRASSAAYTARLNGSNNTVTRASQSPFNGVTGVFAAPAKADLRTNARLAFYSIGEALDLAQLDARVTTLVSHIAFAVNTGLNPTNYDADTIAYVNAGYAAGGTLL